LSARTGDVVHSLIPKRDNSFPQIAIFFKQRGSDKADKTWQYLFGKHRHYVPRVISFCMLLGELATKVQKICIETFFYH